MAELAAQPLKLTHTAELAAAIAVRPAGIIMIRGPRQVGKSTLLRQLAIKAMAEGIAPRSVVLFNSEQFSDRHAMLGDLEAWLGKQQGHCVVLLDEVTSVPQWWLSVKLLADEGKLSNALLVCTGSSALDLASGGDLMPGRRGRRHPVDFELLPAPYRCVAERLSVEEYMLTGGFPWAIGEYLRLHTIPSYVYQIHASWLEGVLLRSGHQTHGLPHLLHRIARTMASPLSVAKLARESGIGSNSTAERYLGLLTASYALIPACWSELSGAAPAPRKNRKFYPLDPFLYHVFADMRMGWEDAFAASQRRVADSDLAGVLAEGVVAAELRRRRGTPTLRYWSGPKELDFAGADGPVEVKYCSHVSAGDFQWTQRHLSAGMQLTVVTKADRARAGAVRLVPLREWLLEGHAPPAATTSRSTPPLP